MSFGFSVGDFIAVGKLITDITNSLRDAGGSKSEYQELLRELDSLHHALRYLDKLQLNNSSSMNLDSIKYAALSCRRPLEQFLSKIKRYDKSLGVWSKEGGLRSAADKLRWAYGQKDEICKLQSYLSVHVGIINILLAEHGLEMMDIASEKVESDHRHIREGLDNTRNIIEGIKSSVTAQVVAVQRMNDMLSRLFQMASGEFRTSWKSLSEMVARVCVSTQQIYCVVLEIKSSLALGDTRWTFFQAPIVVEDALGLKFPLPSEYDFLLLDTIIKHRFLEGLGSLEVKVGNYEFFNTKQSTEVLSPDVRLLPGTSITMAILFQIPEVTEDICPIPRCRSDQTATTPGGGRTCFTCGVRFDRSSKTPKSLKSLQDILDVIDYEYQPTINVKAGTGKRLLDGGDDRPRKRSKASHTVEKLGSFRNVRWGLGKAEKSFNRADVFKRHITSTHAVQQTPPNSRKKTSGNINSTKKLSGYAPDATGKCSTCSGTFSNAQDFYEHLDDCVLRIVQQEEPSEAINTARLAEVEQDHAVHETLRNNALPTTTANMYSGDEDEDEDEHDEDFDDENDDDFTLRSKSARKGRGNRNPVNGVQKSRGVTHSKGGVTLNSKERKKRKDYPSSWGCPSSQMKMKKRVLCVFDGPRRLWKDDMMLDTDYEVRMKLMTRPTSSASSVELIDLA